jgi:hypothetical protein
MDFQEYYRGSKTLTQLRVEEVKILPLDGYREMLYTTTLVGEGFMFFNIIFVPYLSKEPRSGI